ncbi:ubiquinone anaerobic biosynthesis accessory factor UbiT [Lysobacter sp. F60174L2]|uniref:ubiquinone anaerobic biosynthesis accessory factor UbiT n=1 Tax=Lysobacter sp. F60174L2 TaxID=3459295 RepID=UPI00403E128F
MSTAARLALAEVRRAIDVVDDASLLLLAVRGRLAVAAGRCKRAQRRPVHDLQREARVHVRAQRLAARVGVPADTARAAITLAIADARRRQRRADDLGQGRDRSSARTMPAIMPNPSDTPSAAPGAAPARWLLRLLPPPRRLAPALRALPAASRHRAIERACSKVLAPSLASGDLDFMQGRRLGIEVTDLGLRWTVERDGDRLRVGDDSAEASVRGTATDLLLLAARLEDADTLFFQRRLVLTGDVELGLTVRNLLERLPWESVPLGVRIGLNRGARLARAAREAHREGAGPRGFDRG